jgi:flagellar biogenesis protein FliO
MSQSVPDFTTVIVVISFLVILCVTAFVVKKKSGHLKKIIKKENSFEVINQIPLNNGFQAYVFKVDDEKFFFVGHKSGRGALAQIDQLKSKISNSNYKDPKQVSSENISLQDKPKVSKPLQHVNISDLLTAHKKGNKNA